MASSSHSTPFGAAHSVPMSIEPYRDAAGFLPLVPCYKCGTTLIGRVSQKTGSKGKKFYKCPRLEHTEYKCGTYYFEPEYVEYLVKKGKLPRGCSQNTGGDGMAVEVMKVGNDWGMSCQGVEACQDLLESAVGLLKDSEARLKDLVDSQTNLRQKIEKIGEWLLIVGVAQVFVLVLVLLVLLVK